MLNFKSKNELKSLTEDQKVQFCKELNEHASAKGGYGKYLQTVGLGKSITALASTLDEIGIVNLQGQYMTQEQAKASLENNNQKTDQDKLQDILKHYDEIMELVSQKELVMVPSKQLQNATIRVDAEVWDNWRKFTKEQVYNSGDLISKAFQEFMDKYQK